MFLIRRDFIKSGVFAAFSCLLIFICVSQVAKAVEARLITIAAIDTLTPAFVGQTSARLKGSISLDKPYSKVEYYFEYGLTTAYGKQTRTMLRPGGSASTYDVIADVFDLLCGENYHFRLVTQLTDDVDVDTVVGEDVVFQLSACNDVELFPVDVISKSQTSAILSAAYYASGLESTFYVTYGDTVDMPLVTPEVTQVGTNILEPLTGLTCGTKYYYQLFITTKTASLQSPILTFNTTVCPAPPTFNDLPVKDITENSVTFVAEVSPNGATTSVIVDFGPTKNLGQSTPAVSVASNVEKRLVEVPVNALFCGTLYYYQIKIENEKGSMNGRSKSFSTAPCMVEAPVTTSSTVSIFAGDFHSIAIGASGELVLWGNNQFGQLGDSTSGVNLVDGLWIPSIGSDDKLLINNLGAAAGGGHTLVVQADGTVLGFGDNSAGQVGAANDTAVINRPVIVTDFNESALSNVVAITAGEKHSVAVKNDGRIMVWGDNTFGQLGNSTDENALAAIYVNGIDSALDVSAGKNFTIARLIDNTLVGWGQNEFGQLGSEATELQVSPIAITGAENIIGITAGASHVLALDQNGEVMAWGKNQNGQLGLGHTLDRAIPTYVDIDDTQRLKNVIQLAAGSSHSLALISDGTLMGWGDNSLYQLGVDNVEQALTPMVITDPSGVPLRNIIAIGAGDNFSVVLLNNGNILSWGDNSKGQLSGRFSTQTSRAVLTTPDNLPISMNQPRIKVAENSLRIKEGEVAHLLIWLSEEPEQEELIQASFSIGDNFLIERGEQLVFDASNWFKKQTITIKSVKGSADAGELFMESQNSGSVKVSLNVIKSAEAPPKQVVGSMQWIGLLLAFGFLTSCRGLCAQIRGTKTSWQHSTKGCSEQVWLDLAEKIIRFVQSIPKHSLM